MFGPYRVRREIGWGGMGAVYLAERVDDQYRKEVALKVLPRWRGGDQRRLQRFREERQILASLDHRGIARLLDGGVTPDGLPWFAMEYIDGKQIDHYCDSRQLSIEQRLKLFCDVCTAVQYAHRNLVVHRDLKPSNILVDDDGRVALLDFGIAKLLADDSVMADAAKTTGDTLMTPLYASPEQIRGEPTSTSSDVYALGVLLHVLLTGSNPYRLATLDTYEVARAVLEQDADKPSLSAMRETASSSKSAERSISARALARDTTSQKLAKRLRGDLDAIVLRAMSKEPGRRYATVEQLETDVRRHLSGLPVVARPDSRLYHARKFVGRHRVGAGVAAVVAVMVLTFATVMAVQRSRIRAQAARIAMERDRAEQVGRVFLTIFSNIAPGENGVEARDILDSATATVDKQMMAHPEQRARLMFEMASAYHRLEMHPRALELLKVSLALRRNLSPAPNLEVAETLHLMGTVLLANSSIAQADSAYAEALELRRQELGGRHGDVARSLIGLSSARRAQGRLVEAESLSREAIAIDESRGPDARADLAHSKGALAAVMADRKQFRAAAVLFQKSLGLLRETRPEHHPEVATVVFDLASALHGAGDRAAADSLIRYGLGLHRRSLTAALLSGAVDLDATSDRASGDEVTRSVTRAFASKPESVSPALGAGKRGSSQIAFATDRHGPDPLGNLGNEEVYVMNPDGSGQRRLTHAKARDAGPTFSPDGKRIAFSSQRGGQIEIFVMNADGTEQRRLTNFSANGLGAVAPAWSPDGKRIAFNSRV
ncbi:MAG TPA: protein kinase, partial [Casimicrobiaceae bacterium]|nr:protein kinase [Casimicrobiaceae bacterium]